MAGERARARAKTALPSPARKSKNLLKAQNWQELATLPAQAFWRQFQHQMGGAQGTNASRNQESDHLHQALQQAIQDWQKSVTQAVGRADAILPFRIYFQAMGSGVGQGTGQDAPGKTGGRNAG